MENVRGHRLPIRQAAISPAEAEAEAAAGEAAAVLRLAEEFLQEAAAWAEPVVRCPA